MKVYTYSEARQQFSAVLDEAQKTGGVQIRRKDGQVFALKPEKRTKSPLAVKGVKLDLDRDEIVDIIHQGRRKLS